MQIAVMVAGVLAEIVGWWLVSTGRFDVWKLMPVVLGSMGVAAVVVRPPVAAADTSTVTAAVVGAGTGLALYLGTRVFVWIASRWAPFRRDVLEQYGQAGEVTLARSLVLSLAIMVPAEELFWRGLFQGRLGSSDDGGRGCRDRVARVHRGQRRQPEPADRGGRDRRRRRLGRLSRGGRGVCSRAWRAICCGPD